MADSKQEVDLVTLTRPQVRTTGPNWYATTQVPAVLNIPYSEGVQATVVFAVETGRIIVKLWRPTVKSFTWDEGLAREPELEIDLETLVVLDPERRFLKNAKP